MVKLFNTEGVHFPRDTLKAHISLIHKNGKDPSTCSSYRPISLLNVDLKHFTKILTNRLAQHMQDIVHLDQVHNLIQIASVTKTPCIFLSTEKAFDCVNRDFMSTVLKTHRSGQQNASMDLKYIFYTNGTSKS